jgi:serine/threonine protein kinase
MTVETLFALALEKPAGAEREAFLEAACGGDAELRERMDHLLRADDHPSGILDNTPAVPTVTSLPDALTRDRVFAGRFKLREKLGEGGMGEVWVADQTEPVQRRVALKVVRPGHDSDRLVARFEQERQALALMDHPNIARVLDAGVAEGRPYFVMELIKGEPITTYCDAAKLSPRERLELFLPVCHAVQHAHQKGIIHRDLKPSNIMIGLYDGKPVPKVIDFGVAKATGPRLTEKSIYTEVGSLIGTLEYMSPEQAELNNLDVDTRSDIYALGAVLYELLTGSVPFPKQQLQAAAFTEMLRIIKEVEPPKPSTRLSNSGSLPNIAAVRQTEPKKLVAQMRGELDWIVMKCLEKDRSRRYETTNGLALDLQRFLADEPVQAGPPSPSYRLRKFASRNRTLLATGGAFAMILVAATVSSLVLTSWALRERNRTEILKQTAEANFSKALDAVDRMLTRVGETKLEHIPQMELVRLDLLKDALQFYQDFLNEKGDDPNVRMGAVKAYRRVGQIHGLLGQWDEGEKAYLHALELLDHMPEDSQNNTALLSERATVHKGLGILHSLVMRWPQAEVSLNESVAIGKRIEHDDSTNLKNREHIVNCQIDLVLLHRRTGKLPLAESVYRQVMTRIDGLLSVDPENHDYLALRARGYQNGALVLRGLGKTDEAITACQLSVDLNERLLNAQPNTVEPRRRLASTLNNLGLLYSGNNQHEKAEEAYRKSLAHKESISRDYPQVVLFQVELAGAYGNLATHIRMRSPEEALEWGSRAAIILERVLQKDNRYVEARMALFDTLMGRAYAFRRLDRLEEARKEWMRAIEISEKESHINMRLYRPIILNFLGDHDRATSECETMVANGLTQGPNLKLFASVYSLASAIVGSDSRLNPNERKDRVDRYGGRAVELLRQAKSVGHFKTPAQRADVREHKDFDPIRSRSDFQTLLRDLENP